MLGIFALYSFLNRNKHPGIAEELSISPTAISLPKKQSIVFDFKESPVRVSWAVANPQQIGLYSNLKNKKDSQKIKQEKNCKALVNGGFYSKENTHLGLFVSNFQTISQSIRSSLLNSFFWIDNDQKPVMSFDPPQSLPRLALQSGPMLIQKGKPLNLSIINDQNDRRSAITVTKSGQVIFLVIYLDKEEFQGPFLKDLPEALSIFFDKAEIEAVDAINLDGGNASAFLSEFESINEFSQIGSYFCVK